MVQRFVRPLLSKACSSCAGRCCTTVPSSPRLRSQLSQVLPSLVIARSKLPHELPDGATTSSFWAHRSPSPPLASTAYALPPLASARFVLLREVIHAGAPWTDALPLPTVSSQLLVKPRNCPDARASTRRTASPPPIRGAVSNHVAGPGWNPSTSLKTSVAGVPSRWYHCAAMHPLPQSWITRMRSFRSTPSPKTAPCDGSRRTPKRSVASSLTAISWMGHCPPTPAAPMLPAIA